MKRVLADALVALIALTAAAGLADQASAAGTSLQITLTRVSPVAVGPATALVVSGTAHNPGDSVVKHAGVRLRLHPGVLDGREAIDDWLSEGTLTPADTVLPGTAKLRAVGPGATTGFTITVPAGQLGLGTLSGFGPRGFTLESAAGTAQLGTLRSTFVWVPAPPSTRTRLSLIVPITATQPSTRAGSPTEQAAAAMLPGGRLQRLLSATEDKALAWAIDPALLAAAQRVIADGVSHDLSSTGQSSTPDSTGGDGSASAGSSSSSTPGSPGTTTTVADAAKVEAAGTWLSQFRADRRGRGLIGLPYADPDLTATLRSRASIPLLRGADALGRQVTLEALGMHIDTTIAFPANGKLNNTTATRLAANARTAVLLASATQPPDPQIAYTPTGRSTVKAGDQALEGLLYDEQLSGLLRDSGGRSDAAAVQTLLAQMAAITRERPETRHLLAVTPRTWNPNPAGVRALIAALRSAPWVSLRGFNDLRDTPAQTPRTAIKYGTKAKNGELPIGHISAVLAMSRDLTTFAPALKDPDPVISPLRERVTSLLSVNWRTERDRLGDVRSDVRQDVDRLVGAVRLQGGGTKLFTAKSANIPLTVDNSTPYTVRLLVRLKPSSGQLSFPGDVTVTAPANQRTIVLVPTRAVANGNVKVEAKLLTAAGGQLGSSLTFTVRVRPSWETRGMIVAGVVLGLLLVFGLLRGIRRDRARVPPDAVPDVDEQASQRADSPVPGVPGVPGGRASGLRSTDGSSTPEETRDPAMPRETR
jgi:hypothetical protein